MMKHQMIFIAEDHMQVLDTCERRMRKLLKTREFILMNSKLSCLIFI